MFKDGLSGLVPSQNPQDTSGQKGFQVGKVYGIVLNEGTPDAESFARAGGWSGLGSIFYLPYEESKRSSIVDLKKCLIAKPFRAGIKSFPLIGEIVTLVNLPGISSQDKDSAFETYYIETISVWNNVHHNSVPGGEEFILGKTFIENPNINCLQPYEGEFIIESRFGSALRFSSTSRDVNAKNYWSSVGKEGDPITVLTNGLSFDPKSTVPYTETPEKDGSMLILSSTQAIPLGANKVALNAKNNTVSIRSYTGPQAILSANRLILFAKKDEILLISKSTIELNTPGTINLNAQERIHLDSSRIFLGQGTKLPDEPLLLGDKTVSLLDRFLKEIINFASILSSAVSTPQGTPILEINAAAQLMSIKLEGLLGETESLKSKQTYTA